MRGSTGSSFSGILNKGILKKQRSKEDEITAADGVGKLKEADQEQAPESRQGGTQGEGKRGKGLLATLPISRRRLAIYSRGKNECACSTKFKKGKQEGGTGHWEKKGPL